MAKRVLAEYFTFNPSSKTITIPNKIIPRENLLLVVNTVTNTVLYNFSDPDLGIASYTYPYNTTGTQLVLNYNTSGMSSSDAIQIMTDEPNQDIDFSETAQDPTNKLRIAAPQSLIDTDFEYGLQGIKWESFATVANTPAFFYRGGGNSLNLTSIVAGGQTPRSSATVTTATAHGLTTGDLVTVNGTNDVNFDGTYFIQTIPSTTTFTYTGKSSNSTTVSNAYTSVAPASRFDSGNQSSNIVLGASGITSDGGATSYMIVNTQYAHGLFAGAPIQVVSSTTLAANGNWKVYDVPTMTSFRVQVPQVVTAGAVNTSTAAVYVNPEVAFVHRSQDGGVLVSTSTIQEGIKAVRQTRRYFRYQSGKGIQMSSGTKFTPTLDISTITASGTSVTCTIQQPLTFNSGTVVVIDGVQTNLGSTNYYNGTFTITATNPVAKTFTYNTTSNNTDTSPGGIPFATIKNFRGATVRVGMFDAQNGFFFEYDGNYVYATRRDSTKELLGSVSATNGSSTVVGVGTKFSKQLTPGDYIVIRGQSHQVVTVDTDTAITVNPKYRGTTVSGARCNLTVDTKYEQSTWTLDRCDGFGKSGFVLDMSKMQMVYMDYTWYGAGAIRFGFRATNGEVIYCHKIPNNNRNYAAYMRSGNLPARYEVSNEGPYSRFLSGDNTTIGQTLASGGSQMVISNATYWPNSGNLAVYQGNNIEYMSYANKTAAISSFGSGAYVLGGITRRIFGANTSNLTFIATEYDGGTAGTSSICAVNYVTTDVAPVLSHWGTSVIMDGGYNDDRSIVFSYAKQSSITINAGSSLAVISVRLAPAVDNSITGSLGAREVVNRMQLKLTSIDTNSNGPIQISGILNPNAYSGVGTPNLPTDWATTSIVSLIGSASLGQLIDHNSTSVSVTGGEQIFSFLADAGVNGYNLGDVRDLGNSIIAGDGSNKVPGYPNGPDVLTLVVRNVSSGAVTLRSLRFSWTEAQA